MLATEGEVSRDLSCRGSDSAWLLDMLADEGEDVSVTIYLTPGVEGDSDRLVMERDRVAMLGSTMVAFLEVGVVLDWEAAVVELVCLMLLVTMLGV
jgi:2-keto-4-pentenoate hydratase